MVDLGKSGMISPIKILDPFKVIGVTPIKAFLHNFGHGPGFRAIEKNGLHKTLENFQLEVIIKIRLPDFVKFIASFPCKCFPGFIKSLSELLIREPR